MVRREPQPRAGKAALDPYNGAQSLSKTLDKGFPYDDADNSIDIQAPQFRKRETGEKTLVGQLNGNNITKQALVNLVRDAESPITQ